MIGWIYATGGFIHETVCTNMLTTRRLTEALASILLLLLASFTQLALGAGDSAEVVLWNRNYDTAPVDKILELALAKTRDLYPEVTVVRSEPMEQNEALRELRPGGRLDVMSTAANEATADTAISIRFPVLRGLLGVRVCLIRKGDQERFSSIATPYDFVSEPLKICQGAHWPDVDVLRRNGFHTVTRERYRDLFTGLLTGDCDCILRGAQEIVPEWEARQTILDIEERLLFRYLQPGFFHVSRSNPKLAARIELGLLRALDDGSFQEFVDSLLGDAVARLELGDRLAFELVNPNLSQRTRSLQAQKRLWHRYAQ